MAFSVGPVVFQNGASIGGNRSVDLSLKTLYDPNRLFQKDCV